VYYGAVASMSLGRNSGRLCVQGSIRQSDWREDRRGSAKQNLADLLGKVGDQIFTSWNPVMNWLRYLDQLRRSA
jgi:hypothetical protein